MRRLISLMPPAEDLLAVSLAVVAVLILYLALDLFSIQ